MSNQQLASFAAQWVADIPEQKDLRNNPLYVVDAGIASGKTETAIRYVIEEKPSQNVLYVAPTIALLQEIEQRLRTSLAHATEERTVRALHSENGHKVREAVRACIDHTDTDSGDVLCITSDTLISILPYLSNQADWLAILDESIKPYDTVSYRPNDPVYMGLIDDLVDVTEDALLIPKPNQRDLLWRIATQDFAQRGDAALDEYRNPKLAALATLVVNPALHTHAHIYNDGRLFVLSHVDPTHLARFRETIVLTAHFEETLTYEIWSKIHGTEFISHPYFTKDKLRDIYFEQGQYVRIYHALHEEDSASKNTLMRNFTTGQPSAGEYFTPKGERVFDYCNRLVKDRFLGEPYLLAVPGWARQSYSDNDFPDNAAVVTAHVEGLNQYLDLNNVAVLATTNPYPDVTHALHRCLDLNQDDIRHKQRIHTILQTIGRVIRDPDNEDIKNILVLSKADAEFVASKYEGSIIHGQLGGLEPLRQLWERYKPLAPHKTRLYEIPEYHRLRQKLNTLRQRQNRAKKKGEPVSDQLEREIKFIKSDIEDLWILHKK